MTTFCRVELDCSLSPFLVCLREVLSFRSAGIKTGLRGLLALLLLGMNAGAMAVTVSASPTSCTSVTGIGSVSWSNANQAIVSDGNYATASVNTTSTRYLRCVGYSFGIPSTATINGITVNVQRNINRTNRGPVVDAAMRLVKANNIEPSATDHSTTTPYTTTNVYEAHGGAADLWGATWTPTDINNANFGAAFAANGSGTTNNVTVNVDHIQLVVDYTPAAPTVTTADALPVSAFGATLNGTVSSNGAITIVTFDYGLTNAYGSTATSTASPLAANAVNAAVSADVTGLACNTTYHFRVNGVGSGTTNGSDLTFKTSACPPPATCNSGTIASGVINTYYPGTLSVAAGAKSLSVGSATGAATAIAANDLLLIMQIQDESVDWTNTPSYGTVSGTPTTGKYEYAVANGPVSGGILSITGTGAGGGLVNGYTAAAYGSNGQKTFQVIRVPVYSSANLTSGVTAQAWNGSTGGVLAFDVTGALNLNSASVDVSGKGFRGGGGRLLTGAGSGADADFRTLAPIAPPNGANGAKGEGIAGTPRYVYSGSLVDTLVEGYPNGSYARGAPGNAAGGATDGNPSVDNGNNSGGGGGGNWGSGGFGGNYYNETSSREGGIGGAALSGILSASRLTLGGGGGAGSVNNDPRASTGLSSSGTQGGGIVMIRAGSASGSATINANGNAADQANVGNDGSGGGGAGGAILVYAGGSALTGLKANVEGGLGGSNLQGALLSSSSNEHGAGGGGGGGVVVVSAASVDLASSVAGGDAGSSGRTNGPSSYRATPGAIGNILYGMTSAQIPGSALGAGPCAATLSHYAIGHSGAGLTCEAEPITITAHDSSHAPVGAAGRTITLTAKNTSGGATIGTWVASADSCSQTCYDSAGVPQSCLGSFTGTTGNNGVATYVFATGESGVRLCLKQSSAITENINVTDGSVTETSSEDPNLVFSDTGFRFYAAVGAGASTVDTIANQIAGVRNDDATNHPNPQTLTIQALKSGTTTPARCVPLLTNVTRTVQFAYRCEGNPSTCSPSLPKGLQVNGTPVTGVNSGVTPVPADDVSVAFNGSGIGSINLKYFDVGQIAVYARATALPDSTTGSTFAVVTGNSNAFVVKPYAFTVTNVRRNSDSFDNLGASDATGFKFMAAGDVFSVTVTATALGGTKAYSFGRCDGSGGTGCSAATESVSLSSRLVSPSGGVPGSLGGSTSANASSFVTSSGSYTFNNLNWSEVGVITLAASNSNYLTNGLGTCSTQTGGEKCQGTFGSSGNVGRFTPHHFGLTGSVVTRSDLQSTEGQTTPFTYMDEPMKMTLSVTAYNANHSPAPGVTQNYAGNFAKLDAATLCSGNVTTCATGMNGINWFNTGCTAGTQCMGLGAVNVATGLSGRLAVDTSVANPSSLWSQGVGTFTVHTKLSRLSSGPDGPYDTLNIGGMPQDSDGVSVPGTASSDTHKVNLDATNGNTLGSNPDGTAERRQIFTTKARFGRLKMQNMYGSEKLPLAIPLQAQYWSVSYFINNADDNNTPVTAPSARAPTGTPPDGTVNLYFYAVPAKNLLSPTTDLPTVKTVDDVVTDKLKDGKAKLQFAAPLKIGWLDIILQVPDYLKYNWGNCNGQGTDTLMNDFPCARGTFGTYKSPLIYRRENY